MANPRQARKLKSPNGPPSFAGVRAVAYMRVSTAEQAHSGLGLEAQREAIRAAADRLGLKLSGVFVDAGLTGDLPADRREGLTSALTDLKKGEVLLVAKRDRLARDAIETALIERELGRRSCRIISAAGEGTESDSPQDVFQRRVLDAVSEYEKGMIRARTRAALQAKKKRGERAGTVPFGFRVADPATGKLERNPDEVAVIVAVARARGAGLSHREIVARLAEDGVVSPRSGRPLALAQVQRILARYGAKRKAEA